MPKPYVEYEMVDLDEMGFGELSQEERVMLGGQQVQVDVEAMEMAGLGEDMDMMQAERERLELNEAVIQRDHYTCVRCKRQHNPRNLSAVLVVKRAKGEPVLANDFATACHACIRAVSG